jgi:hypothetical protein
MLRYVLFVSAVVASAIAVTVSVRAEMTSKESAYIAQVSAAAPAAVSQNATIVQMQGDGSMRTLRTGTNDFTCMVLPGGGGTPMCADKNAMSWMHAVFTKGTPPDATGFIYMLGGDEGASNTDPYATAQTASNHWVKTGPHVMIVGPTVKTMGYPATADPDVTKPYVMWPDTAYAHLMLPVSTSKP